MQIEDCVVFLQEDYEIHEVRVVNSIDEWFKIIKS